MALDGRFPEISHFVAISWELHIKSDRLLAEVGRQIERFQDQVKVIVLGYGRCQAMDQMGNDFKVPILRPEAEDCIGVLLGQQRCEKELQRCPGTWFLFLGWIQLGTDFVFQELQLNGLANKEIDLLQFA